jgi:hypothetical protein
VEAIKGSCRQNMEVPEAVLGEIKNWLELMVMSNN